MNIKHLLAGSIAGLAMLAAAACSSGSTPDFTPAAANDTPASTSTAGAPPQTSIPTSVAKELSTAELVKLAEPAIVRIETSGGVGTGFIVADDGYIVTNNHVVASTSTRARTNTTLKVTTSDGADYQATIVGTDVRTDLAVIKIDAKGLTPLKVGSLENTEIGQDVVAIGYALDLQRGEGPSFSVTRGIVSQKNRAINETATGIFGAIQTDAAINHGNSGGPLLNLKGEVVGVNTSLAPDPTTGGAAAGIGFAVGADTVKAVYQEIRASGKVSRGLLGITNFVSLRPAKAKELGLESTLRGVWLGGTESVSPGGPAATGGLRTNDVITNIGGDPIRSEADLAVALIKHHAGETVEIQIYRDGKQQTLKVTLGTPTS